MNYLYLAILGAIAIYIYIKLYIYYSTFTSKVFRKLKIRKGTLATYTLNQLFDSVFSFFVKFFK
ncbi:hypothetical protein KBC75_01685 [Candidatus Shapirobacteria bacterium]|nr:hypothetical protein [Candidatus Shapirobacteria bacterium]